ncbi:isochorismate synthase [Entomohabitans teleogrylli]|uniref:isochorismate synthase n=1 Tax=Entomohabitans teleogrylli TaxID=1384589 RepID=UPI00073D839F|nr:isochorismate synthase [Entomohabitans teleogrylli]
MDMALIEGQTQPCPAPVTDRFLFMSPFRSLCASGCFTRIHTPAQDGDQLHGHFQKTLAQAFDAARQAGIAEPVVVGAIPFDPRRPTELVIPRHYQWLSREACQAQLPAEAPPRPQAVSRQEIPDRPVFLDMVARGARAAAGPAVDKVVLSRLIDIACRRPLDSLALMRQLVAQNPASFNFHFPLADGSVLLGASPELLLRKEGNHFSSLPLAGSAPRHVDRQLDLREGEALMRSEKDRHEHQLVIQAMRSQLSGRSLHLEVPQTPSLITTPTLWHLGTPIEGLCRAGENALSLACLLHPTPALSGFPHQAARELIAELEPFDRDLFGGIVGWSDAQGNGEWVVTIRSARLQGERARFFAGAGIVPASSPESEWHETGVKLSTMLKVFGLH